VILDLARLLADTGAVSVFGALLFRVLVAPMPLRGLLHLSGVVALVGMAWWLDLEAAAYGGGIADVALHTWFGQVLLARAGLLVVALLLPGWLGVAVAAASIVAAVGHGHAVAMGDMSWLVVCEAGHVLAAAAWLGGLVPLALAIRTGDDRAASRFSRLGLAAVTLLAATAACQGYVLAGGLPGLIGTTYGAVLGVKLALFLVLLGFAARHRLRLVPGLPATRRALVHSIGTQAILGVATLTAAVVVAQMPPGMHAQPWWPFAWRPDAFAFAVPELRGEVIAGLAWCALAVVLAGLALRRWWFLLGMPLALWLGVPHLDLLFVPAYPTSYYTEPDPPSPESLARGAVLYPQLCARCHGPQGRGDGPDAKGLAVLPADLTAGHLWDHSDGELFWWLSAGIHGPDGAPVMPGFAAVLSEQDRWALIDLIRSRNPTLPAGAVATQHHHH
jgi:putative copper export protein/mono/diheme cytochrome c family protein